MERIRLTLGVLAALALLVAPAAATKGKPPKVALCAAARKLLRIAWAVATKDQDFDPAYCVCSRREVTAG